MMVLLCSMLLLKNMALIILLTTVLLTMKLKSESNENVVIFLVVLHLLFCVEYLRMEWTLFSIPLQGRISRRASIFCARLELQCYSVQKDFYILYL